ncbi:hypothetical protein E4T39_00747 [Aureobasidium subglaciale]|nr:hypothetical protein E4T39_00747 [Aureobasidium subglaciale]
MHHKLPHFGRGTPEFVSSFIFHHLSICMGHIFSRTTTNHQELGKRVSLWIHWKQLIPPICASSCGIRSFLSNQDTGTRDSGERHSLCKRGLGLAISCLEFLFCLSRRTLAAIIRGNVLGEVWGFAISTCCWFGGLGDRVGVFIHYYGIGRRDFVFSECIKKHIWLDHDDYADRWRWTQVNCGGAHCSPEYGGGQNAMEKGRSFRQGLIEIGTVRSPGVGRTAGVN